MQLRSLFIVAILASHIAYSQTYNFRHYKEEEGLHQNYIYCISQSTKGYLTLSTGEGLCMFDGNKFHYYSNKQIAQNFVTTHYIDARDITWLGHNQNGISYFKNGDFFSIQNRELKQVKVTKLDANNKKNIWAATSGAGLFLIDTSFRATHVENCIPVINDFCFDASGQFMLATPSGLYIAKVYDNKLVVVDSVDFLSGENIKLIVPAKRTPGCFWVSTEEGKIYGIEKNKSHFKNFFLFEADPGSSNNITCIYSDIADNLWIGLFGGALRKISFRNGITSGQFHVTRIEKNNGLPNQHIQSVFQDIEGNMWFGTFGDGLIEKPVEKFSFYGKKEGIENTDIGKIVIDSSGCFWIASNAGLASFKKENNSYKKYNSSNGFLNDKINALLVDAGQTLWIGTENNGIFTLDPKTKKFSSFSKKHNLTIPTINVLLEVGNEVLMGTTEGIYQYAKENNHVELITTDDGLLHNNVKNLYQDSRGRLWVCSYGAPPYYIKDRRITAFKDIPGLNSFNINAVTEDKKGIIWIATEGDGVFRYDGRTFTNYKTENGLLSDYCVGIETDANNSVWVTHRSGLSEKKEFHKNFSTHTSRNGLLFFENNLNAVYKDALGNLWFGTTAGLVHYDTDLGLDKQAEPNLFITKIKLNGVEYPSSFHVAKKYGYYSVQVDYLAISLTDPKSIKYKYRLLGIDSTWKGTGLCYADFPRLSDGSYTFQVIACNGDGLCTSKPAEIMFEIEPPVWKRTWFYALVAIAIVMITYIAVFVRIKNLKKVQSLLKETVRQKTFLLQREKEQVEKIKIELEHKNKDITDSINYAKRLQDSLLPPDYIMNKLFHRKCFVFYRPKDIVSGDFYWTASVTRENDSENNLSLAAVIDCTGHGVPGAFLSIVANDFLKQSTIDQNVHNPNDILDYLNRSVISNLNQSANSKVKVKDGMDIALVAIDYKNHKLYFSGANNPAYVYRKVAGKIELIVLKSDKQAIGQALEKNQPYTLQEFDLASGDTIYLFSDGYADQFGGGKDKKLNYKRFKEILAHAFELPIGLQKNFVEKKFLEWKGETEQTDDVCIMGIRI